MEAQQLEDWVDILDTTNYAPHKDPDNLYQSYRFVDLDINSVTTKNYRKKLCKSLIEQVEIFIPPSGSFNNCKILLSHPYENTSFLFGSSTSEFF